ncbi:hypothetical protein [Bosea sp. (in: a-proteobacteria)]|uniref:hypothetical protein n=1 Tax=Bosea sp. (in: a-proteobacteria) TaxID=1871050 RepID=UPI002FCA51CB
MIGSLAHIVGAGCLLFALIATSGSAGAGSFVKLSKIVDDGTRAAGKQADDLAGRGMRHGDDALRTTGLHTGDPVLEEAVSIYRTMPQDFSRSISLSDEYPNLEVRVHASQRYDLAIQSFARRRFEAMLAERFSIDDLKIVTLGMADDARRSTDEAARVKRYIGRGFHDDVGPLANLHAAEYPGQAAKVAALTPYRGRTIVLVGHIPDDIGDFFVFGPTGRVKIPIAEWMSAAGEAGVNLIPLGCHSERLAQLGAKGVINSGTAVDRLQQVLTNPPTTIGEFFARLTSRDLVLVVDPLDLRIFSNSAEIVARETRERIGRVVFHGARLANAARSPGRSVGPTDRSYDSCFAAANPDGFARCMAAKQEEKRREAALAARVKDAEARQQERSMLPAQLARTAGLLDGQMRASLGMTILYILIWPLSCFLIFHGLMTARWIELENGPSIQSIFSRRSIREGLSTAGSVLVRPFSAFAVYLVLIVPFVLGALVFIDIGSHLSEGWRLFFLIAAGPLAVVVIGILWSAIITTFRESSLANGVAVLSFAVLIVAAYQQISMADGVQNLRRNEVYLRDRLAELKSTELADARLLSQRSR